MAISVSLYTLLYESGLVHSPPGALGFRCKDVDGEVTQAYTRTGLAALASGVEYGGDVEVPDGTTTIEYGLGDGGSPEDILVVLDTQEVEATGGGSIPPSDDPAKASVVFDMAALDIDTVVCRYEDALPLQLGTVGISNPVAATETPDDETGDATAELYKTSSITDDNEDAAGLYTVIGLKNGRPCLGPVRNVSVPDVGGRFDVRTGTVG